jgi:hypothetical protein
MEDFQLSAVHVDNFLQVTVQDAPGTLQATSPKGQNSDSGGPEHASQTMSAAQAFLEPCRETISHATHPTTNPGFLHLIE